jgi:hypothetical protein
LGNTKKFDIRKEEKASFRFINFSRTRFLETQIRRLVTVTLGQKLSVSRHEPRDTNNELIRRRMSETAMAYGRVGGPRVLTEEL